MIIGWPKAGKTTYAGELAQRFGMKHLCTDPQKLCPPGVTGAPDHLDWSALSQYVADQWLGMDNAVIEGVAVPRSLRKWKAKNPGKVPPCDLIIWLKMSYGDLLPGQISMGKGLDGVMGEILPWIHATSCPLKEMDVVSENERNFI